MAADPLSPPLCALILGSNWSCLPAVVRQFHGERTLSAVRTSRGQMSVQWGTSTLARLLCRILRFPASGADVPVNLAVKGHGASEEWQRDFAGKMFCTRQWHGANNLLAESFGPFVLLFALTGTASGLAYNLAAMRFLRLPLPSWFRPRVAALELASPDGSRVVVDVEAAFPKVGLLLRYTGYIAPA